MRWNENIKSLRVRDGLTQKELGQRLRVTQSAIAQLERGEVNPKINTLDRVATALGVDLLTLFTSCKEEYQPVKLSIQYSGGMSKVLSKLRPDPVEDCTGVSSILGNGLLRDMVLEGLGVSDRNDVVEEKRRVITLIDALRAEGYEVIKESTTIEDNALLYNVKFRTATGMTVELVSALEYEEDYVYSKCSVTVADYLGPYKWGISIPEGCGLSVVDSIDEFTIISDVLRTPVTATDDKLYISRLTGYRLYFG